MKFLRKLMGIDLPSVEEVEQQQLLLEEEIIRQIQQEQDLKLEEPPVEPLAYLNFLLMPDGTVLLQCDWNNNTSTVARAYAHMLNCIFQGEFEEITHKTLLGAAETGLENRSFVKTVFDELKLILEKQDEPLVHPEEAFGIGPQAPPSAQED
jgi:hypothetical protein